MKYLVILLVPALCFAQPDIGPDIELRGGGIGNFKPGDRVTKALKKFNAKFKINSLSDYTAGAGEVYKTPAVENSTGDCEQRTPPPIKALPMAVVGDFNGDSKDDAIVMGHDDKQQLVLGVLSGEKEFRVSVIEKRAKSAAKLNTTLSLVESATKAKLIDFYVKCLPPSVKRFRTDALIVGDVMSDHQRLYFFNGTAFKVFKPGA